MPYLAHYDLATGAILGLWSSTNPELLRSNIRPEETGQGYLFFDDPEAGQAPDRYEVRGEALVPRTMVELVATPSSFAADGMATCTVSPVPFVPCTLVIGEWPQETTVALVAEDDPLVLTADSPQRLRIALQPLPGYWAAPLTVEALPDATP
jgi:hypothetical protein